MLVSAQQVCVFGILDYVTMRSVAITIRKTENTHTQSELKQPKTEMWHDTRRKTHIYNGGTMYSKNRLNRNAHLKYYIHTFISLYVCIFVQRQEQRRLKRISRVKRNAHIL